MIDINYSLRVAYNTALANIAGTPVFYNTLPPNVSPNNYIIFRSITNTDASTCNTSDINCQVTVEIQTWNDGLNSGLDADQAAREVINRILPNPGATLTIDGAQMISTRLLNDISQPPIAVGNRSYVSRVLTFGHKIFLRSDIS